MTNDKSATMPAGRDLAGQLKDSAVQVKDETKQRVSGVAAQAQEQVASRISDQKDTTAESLSGVAQALRQTGQQLRDKDQVGVTDYIDQAAEQVERLSGYLRDNNLGQLMGDVEHFARRQPTLFLGGAFVLGLVGARFLKSSRPSASSNDYTSYAMGERQPYTQGYSAARGIYDNGEYTRYKSYLGDEHTAGETRSAATHEPRARSHGEPLEK